MKSSGAWFSVVTRTGNTASGGDYLDVSEMKPVFVLMRGMESCLVNSDGITVRTGGDR